jgi:tetratricopeptide (TPR) repeat protein
MQFFLFDRFYATLNWHISKYNCMKSRLILLFTVAGIMWSAWMQGGSVDSLISILDTTLINEAQVELRLEIASEISNSDIKGALEHAREALQGAEQIGSERLKAEAQLAIGKFYDYLGVRQEAIDHLMEANQTFGALGQTHDQAHTLMYIGNTYWYLNQFESALKYYSEVSRIAY